MNQYQFISEFIVSHFPDSELKMENDPEILFKIQKQGMVILEINHTGTTYFCPNRYRSNILTWRSFLEGSLESISEHILKDLADAGFLTFDRRGKRIIRKAVKLGKTTCCPKCQANGTIKRYFFGLVGLDSWIAKNRFPIGRSRRRDDPEAMCLNCDWTGSTEIFRFPKKEV